MKCNALYLCIFVFVLQGCAGIPVPAPVLSPTQTPQVQPRSPQAAAQAEALLQALLALGIDYQYGSSSPVLGFDCSGLVAYVYREAYGLRLPRTTGAQSESGRAVSLADVQAGDLVFYDTQNRPYSHVGIYLGEGRFVHAPKAGARVRVERMESPYWKSRFNGARRIVGWT